MKSDTNNADTNNTNAKGQKMSAFIVNNGTLDLCVSGFAATKDEHISPENRTALGQSLLDMNAIAVASRYGERPAELTYSAPPSRSVLPSWRGLPLAYRCQIVQAMKCLRYQCTESGTVDAPLYRELCNTISELESMIVAELSPSKDAAWNPSRADLAG